MNLYVQQRSFLFTFLHKISTFYKYKFNVFLSININLGIIRHASINVKNMLHISYLSKNMKQKKSTV